jgi:cellulose biosynthesis protein BcsQ
MLIATWSQKGGSGKTTIAVQGVSFFGAKVLDLDPSQEDLAKWAAKNGTHCERWKPAEATQRLVAAADDDAELWWADCHPGDEPRENLFGIAFAQVVVIPVRGGGDQDLAQLGRCISRIKEIRAAGNPDLKLAVVFNAARDSARDRAGELAVRTYCATAEEVYLGQTKLRNAYADAYSDGSSVFSQLGPARDEMLGIMERLGRLLPPEFVARRLPSAAPAPITVQLSA